MDLVHAFLELIAALVGAISSSFFFTLTLYDTKSTLIDICGDNCSDNEVAGIWVFALTLAFICSAAKFGLMVNSCMFAYERLTGRTSNGVSYRFDNLTLIQKIVIVELVFISFGCSSGDAYLNYIGAQKVFSNDVSIVFFVCNLITTTSILVYGTIDTIFEINQILSCIKVNAEKLYHYKRSLILIVIFSIYGKVFNYWLVKKGTKEMMTDVEFFVEMNGILSVLLFGIAYSRRAAIEAAENMYSENGPIITLEGIKQKNSINERYIPSTWMIRLFSAGGVGFLTYLSYKVFWFDKITEGDGLSIALWSFVSTPASVCQIYFGWNIFVNEVRVLPHEIIIRLKIIWDRTPSGSSSARSSLSGSINDAHHAAYSTFDPELPAAVQVDEE